MSHTKGPWELERDNTLPGVVRVVAQGRTITIVDLDGKANALLIAASLDLLEACQQFIARYENDLVRADLLFSDIADKARSAIAKATGKEVGT